MQEPATNTAQPLVEVAQQGLRSAIIRGDLQPGARLKIDSLSRSLGLSSSPIREALNRLAQEGIVNAEENRGFWVPPLSEEAFRELVRLRCLLEGEAIRESVEKGGDDWEAGVLAAHHRLELIEKKLPAGPVALNNEWSQRHKAFHLALMSGCTSALLLQMIDSLFDKAERYRRFSALHRSEARHKGTEHQALMKAALARETDKTVTLLTQHIEGTLDRVLTALRKIQ
ncbi:FCD domain-containing protein [Cupriavidus sp. AcVe19-6a]|uniref:FCD domain-containing protein n=1 Tax=Cupriavidus sp. AcVe19-6a TaxID=2821358 RepID=UPI001AEBA1A2|nr:FCD domain-containing protein [Cupriavidus sp. AcVe19-6a]MBP0638548.1 FCD domain-containing protein [Cupriavidus sp. AcVe19-6a]